MLQAGGRPSWAPSWSARGKSHCLKVPRVQKVVAMGDEGYIALSIGENSETLGVDSVRWVKFGCAIPKQNNLMFSLLVSSRDKQMHWEWLG